jgi:hypothetical protein
MSMPELRVVVASPGDVKPEREVMPDVIDEINRSMGAVLDVQFKLSRWETDAYPGFHAEGPQGLIDPILRIEDCDILVGIFWKRFGTPTHGVGSGTEHEIATAYEAWQHSQKPQIMVYFKEAEYFPRSVEETRQSGKVLGFKESFPEEGLWWPFKETGQFKDLVRGHLQNWLRDRFQKERSGRTSGIREKLKQARREIMPLRHGGSGDPVDRTLITDYNLESLVQVFSDTLVSGCTSEEDYEGAFCFLIRGPDRILDEYVIERLLKTLGETTGRENTKHRVWLHAGNFTQGLKAIKAQLGIDYFRQLCEGGDDIQMDVVLVIANRGIPSDTFLKLAASFWGEIEMQISNNLSHPSRCFIVLWADDSPELLEQQVFKELPVPRQFELRKLRLWLKVELKRHRVDESWILSLIHKIECHGGELYCTYQTLQDELGLLGGNPE